MTQPVSPDRTSTPPQDRGRAPARQPASRDAAGGGALPSTALGDTVRLAQGAVTLTDILAARPSGQIKSPEDAARLASRVSEQLRQDPSGALLAFGATRDTTAQSLLATA